MNKTHYYSLVVKTLQDEVADKNTNAYCVKNVFKYHENIVDKLSSSCLFKEELGFLIKFSFSTSNFVLTKVPQSKTIQEAIQVQNNTSSMVAGQNCTICCLSNIVLRLLKPFLSHIKSYIKTKYDFLVKYFREDKWDAILTIFDIV